MNYVSWLVEFLHFPKFRSWGALYGKSMIANISSSDSTGIGSPGIPVGSSFEWKGKKD